MALLYSKVNTKILGVIVILACVKFYCEHRWSSKLILKIVIDRENGALSYFTAGETYNFKSNFTAGQRYDATSNFSTGEIYDTKSNFTIGEGYARVNNYTNTTKYLNAILQRPQQKTLSKELFSVSPENLAQPCPDKGIDGECLTEYYNKTFVKLFQKYQNLLNKKIVPEIPCDNYLEICSSCKGVNKSSDNKELRHIGIINDQVLNDSVKELCINASDLCFYNNNSDIRDQQHFMSVTSSIGRIGNQLFQIAALLGMACLHGYRPIIPPTFVLTKSFDLPYVKNVTITNTLTYSLIDTWGMFVNTSIDPAYNWTLYGCFQSFKFFENSFTVLRRSVVVKKEYLDRAYNFTKSISKEGYENVCLHIRRGDMVTNESKQQGYTLPDSHFFNKSMQFYQNKYKFVNFIVISNDIPWCKNKLPRNIVYSPFTDGANDMALMCLCDHVIVTAGTFGWWGAFLSGGTTVYFRNFVRNDSGLAMGYRPEDYYPPTWIGIS